MNREKLQVELLKELKIYSEMNGGLIPDIHCKIIAKFSSKICMDQFNEKTRICCVCGVDITDTGKQLFCEKHSKDI